ncbi:uncharacterized protein LOC121373401 [Gigantopelta aegis]|uniref:uncharacterized protein LOC121373401 n=1 Tax=Gigantopelta aegis TaxID=1735272 RepID=UPI001B88E09B|nr:uncharacterized protein LOC121373401 [Gigantopelta aegis]
MAEKSDGLTNIAEQIRRLEKEKEALEKRQKEKEEADRANEEKRLLQQKLSVLQQEVTSLKGSNTINISPSTSAISPGGRQRRSYGFDVRDSDVLGMLGDNKTVQNLQNQFLGSPNLARGNYAYSEEETSEEDAEDVMSTRHKQMLQQNRDILVENMIPDDIFNDLIASKILTTADVGRIKEKNTRESMNEELLNNIVRRSDRAFHVFVRSLRKTLQDYLANRIDPSSRSSKKKRKRHTGELNVNVDCEEVTPLNKKRGVCTCQEVEEQILIMAKNAYRNIRRRDGTPAAFEQFRKELGQTNAIIKDSMEIMHTLKILCRHGEVTDVSYGSVKFTMICPSVFVVKDLWQLYVSGKLLEIFQDGLVTKTLRKVCKARDIRLRVRILEREYLQCLRELEMKDKTISASPVSKRVRPSHSRVLRSTRKRNVCENISNQSCKLPHPSGETRRAFKEIHTNTPIMPKSAGVKKLCIVQELEKQSRCPLSPCNKIRLRSQDLLR